MRSRVDVENLDEAQEMNERRPMEPAPTGQRDSSGAAQAGRSKVPEVRIPLKPQFRFMHEPVGAEASARFVGRERELETLVERVLFSNGGSFLITGYRGVGKTSFVNQVVYEIERRLPRVRSLLGQVELLDIHVNLARPLLPAELMHHVIRRVHERLEELGLFTRLPKPLWDRILLAYRRTSVNMSRSVEESSGRSVGLGDFTLGGKLLQAAFKGSLEFTSQKGRTEQISYLGYDDKAAEYDLVRIARELSEGFEPRRRWFERLFDLLPNRKPAVTRVKVVFIFDELDKLEAFGKDPQGGQRPLDEILGALKNLFTTSGISFIFVAGRALRERWAEDLGRGDSVYESVFCFEQYLPCLWVNGHDICSQHVDWNSLEQSETRETGADAALAPQAANASRREPLQEVFDEFAGFLEFRGRGIPRRIVKAFAEYVRWEDQRPFLAFERRQLRRIRFYAELQALLAENRLLLFGDDAAEASPLWRDRRKLGVYYLVDWILRKVDGDFALDDVVGAAASLSRQIVLPHEIASRLIVDLIAILVEEDYLEEVMPEAERVQIDVVNAREQPRYRLSRRRVAEMGGLIVQVASRKEMGPDDGLETVGDYQLEAKIGSGGVASVYQGIHRETGHVVAVKILHARLADQDRFKKMLSREGETLKALQHPNVVRYVQHGEEGGRPYLAMEYVDGLSVSKLIEHHGHLSLEETLAIAEPAGRALDFIHSKGYVRNDVKPGNVLVSQMGAVRLIDFGTASTGDEGSADMMMGTPSYMAPEQLEGARADIRSEVYSFGVMLYQMLTGRLPLERTRFAPAGGLGADIIRPVTELAPDLPETVGAAVMRCLERDPAQRFGSVGATVDALRDAAGPLAPADLGELMRRSRELEQESKQREQFDTLVGDFSQVALHHEDSARSARPRTAPIPPEASPEPEATLTEDAGVPGAPSPEGGAGMPAEVEPGSPDANEPRPVPSAPVLPAMSSAVCRAAPTHPVPALPLAGIAAQGHEGGTGSCKKGQGPLLEILQGSRDIGRRFPLSSPVTTMGRSRSNDIALDGHLVSRFHARIVKLKDGYTIEDLNSSNGLLHNGVRVTGAVRLVSGDRIRLDKFLLRFSE